MRHSRLLAPEAIPHPVYHCVSRVVDRRAIFGDAEKEHFVKLMRLYAHFCGLVSLTYCVMDNHFHLLVEVPRRPEKLPTNEALIGLVEMTYGLAVAEAMRERFKRWLEQGNAQAVEEERERWFARMWDLGCFMKLLKQCFSQWYNKRAERKGTLWEERYCSVLVETGEALRAISLYIDLNPVRAGMVEDPKDYRWCGYGEAVAGQAPAMQGLARMATLSSPALANRGEDSGEWLKGIKHWYREGLFRRGEERCDAEGRVVRRGFSETQVEAVRDAGGQLPLGDYVRLRVRYFTAGVVLGSQAFVESVFHARREWFSSGRRTGARRLKGLHVDCPLRAGRDLVVRPFG